MDSSISADACSRDSRDAISTFPFQRTFDNNSVGACPLDFAGQQTFCRQQHMGGAIIGQDSRSMTTRFRGGPLHEIEVDYRNPGMHVSALPGERIGDDAYMHEVQLGDRRRMTVQQPWGYSNFAGGGEPLPSRPTDTRSANYTTSVLGDPYRR